MDLTLREGEVLGISGLGGSGTSETLRALFGIDPLVKGTLTVNGEEVRFRNPSQAMKKGLALIPEDKMCIRDRIDTAEEEYLKKGQFKVAIAFHCTDTEWSRLQEMAIRDTLARYNVQVVAVMDANFNAQLQVCLLYTSRCV